MVKISKSVEEALFRIRLRRKYSAVLLKSTDENIKLLKKLRNYIAYGVINKETLEKLIELRGKSIDRGKIDSRKIVSEIEKKNLEKLGLKPFFRLHPPRNGIES